MTSASVEASPPAATLPAGMLCPACLYPIGGQIIRTCSECGRQITSEDVNLFEQLNRIQAANSEIEQRTLIKSLCIAGMYAIGAGGLNMWVGAVGGALVMAFVTFVLTSLALGGTDVVGRIVVRMMPRHEQPLWWRVWQRNFFWMHAPWLVAPLAVAVFVCTAWMLPRGKDDVAVLGFGGWLLGCVIGLGWIWARQRIMLQQLGVKDSPRRIVLVLATVLVLAATMALGILAGGFSVMFATSLASRNSSSAYP